MELYCTMRKVGKNHEVRSPAYLTFAPKGNVTDVFDDLGEDVLEELQPVNDYIEDNYVKVRKCGRRRTQTISPPNMSNSYHRALERLPRTTNRCEAAGNRTLSWANLIHPFTTCSRNYRRSLKSRGQRSVLNVGPGKKKRKASD